MPYLLHPSEKLVAQFKEKPWQGCNPKDAEFLFIGLDANYAADVEATLPELFDYHHCGVNFWRRHKIHHPFLLPHYRGSGKKYHQKFAQIGFTEAHADRVSFLELLHLPTVGTNKLEIKDLSHSHLELLADVLNHGAARFVFMPSKVVTTLKHSSLRLVTAKAGKGGWQPWGSAGKRGANYPPDVPPLMLWVAAGSSRCAASTGARFSRFDRTYRMRCGKLAR